MRERENAMENGVSKKISVLDITNEMRRERGGETIGILHARPIGRTKGRGKGGNSDAEGTRSERNGGMHLCIAAIYDAELWRFSPRMCARIRVYVRTRSYLNRRNQFHFWNGLRPSVRSSARLYVCPRTNDLETALRGELN